MVSSQPDRTSYRWSGFSLFFEPAIAIKEQTHRPDYGAAHPGSGGLNDADDLQTFDPDAFVEGILAG